jgi:hypothetical protein
MKSICLYLCIIVALLAGLVGLIATDSPDIKREISLKESIARLSAEREAIRNEVLALKRELQALKSETNQVITIKVTFSPNVKPILVEQE